MANGAKKKKKRREDPVPIRVFRWDRALTQEHQNPRAALLSTWRSGRAPLAEGDVEELRRMCWITTTRILRAASNGLQAVPAPTLRLVPTLDLESKWEHASRIHMTRLHLSQLRAQLYFQAVPHREKVDKFYPEVSCEGNLRSIPNLLSEALLLVCLHLFTCIQVELWPMLCRQ